MDVDDLHSARLVGETNLDAHLRGKNLNNLRLIGRRDHLQSAWPGESLINHVWPVGHPNHQDVVQSVYTVDLGQQLVHDGVVDTRAAGNAASFLADGIDLVEDNDVQTCNDQKMMV